MNPSRLRLIALIGLLFATLSGCTHYVYGVPRDQWRQMNTYDRAETRRVYELRHPHVEHVYRDDTYMGTGEATASSHHYPQRVYLHLSGGFFVIRGHHYAFQPQAFQLRHGETRELILTSSQSRLPHRVKLWVRYLKGKVMLGDGRRYLHTVAYRDGWHRGEHYRGVRFHGDVHLENANLFIGPRPLSQQPQHGRDIPPGTQSPVYQREPNHQDEVPPINGDHSGRDDDDGINSQGQDDNGRNHQESAQEKKARLKKERREKNKAEREKAMEGMTREERAKLREERRGLNRQKKAEREKAKKDKKDKKDKVKKDKVEKEKVEKEKVEKEKVKKDKVKKEKDEGSKECIENGKVNGKKKNGLPYCDE